VRRTLKAGETYRAPVHFVGLGELAPGEYEAWVEHAASKLRSARVRFRVVP